MTASEQSTVPASIRAVAFLNLLCGLFLTATCVYVLKDIGSIRRDLLQFADDRTPQADNSIVNFAIPIVLSAGVAGIVLVVSSFGLSYAKRWARLATLFVSWVSVAYIAIAIGSRVIAGDAERILGALSNAPEMAYWILVIAVLSSAESRRFFAGAQVEQ